MLGAETGEAEKVLKDQIATLRAEVAGLRFELNLRSKSVSPRLAIMEAKMPPAIDLSPDAMAERCFEGYVLQSQMAGLTITEISRELLRRSISLLGQAQMEAIAADPRIALTMVTHAMRFVADNLDAGEPCDHWIQ